MKPTFKCDFIRESRNKRKIYLIKIESNKYVEKGILNELFFNESKKFKHISIYADIESFIAAEIF